MTTTTHTLEAEVLADAILMASGSALRHYTMQKTRDAILASAQAGIDNARADLLEALESMVATAKELMPDWTCLIAERAIERARGRA